MMANGRTPYLGESAVAKRTSPALTRLMVDCKHKPTLEFYPYIDKVGIRLGSEFPDWARGQSFLRLLDKRRHRALTVHYRGVHLLCDQPERGEFTFAKSVCLSAIETLKADRFDEVIVQTLYTHAMGGMGFDLLRSLFAAKFLSLDPALGEIFGEMTDLGFLTDFQRKPGEHGKARLGPMKSAQWFEINDYQAAGTFEPGESFEQFKKSLPETFLFMEITLSRKDAEQSEIDTFLQDASVRSFAIANDIVDYMNE